VRRFHASVTRRLMLSSPSLFQPFLSVVLVRAVIPLHVLQ
jgi:hypothetical protein